MIGKKRDESISIEEFEKYGPRGFWCGQLLQDDSLEVTTLYNHKRTICRACRDIVQARDSERPKLHETRDLGCDDIFAITKEQMK